MTYDADTYRGLFNHYEGYTWAAYRKLMKYIPSDAVNILSIGCGLGDIEKKLPFNVTCYDPYSPVVEYHDKPTGNFDYSFSFNAVMSSALPDERRGIVDYALSVSPAYLIDRLFQTWPHADDCFNYTEWNDAELFEGYCCVNKGYRFFEVRHVV